MAQDTLVEIKCRLCLEKGLDMVDILSVERMSEKVHSFLQIEVSIRLCCPSTRPSAFP